MREARYLPLSDYALLGDGRGAALVGRDGSLDWLCVPRFDSPALFSRILDAERGGSWSLAPAEPSEPSFRYLQRTAVLETEHRTAGGVVRVHDAFLPAAEGEDEPPGVLARVVEGLAGEVEVVSLFDPRPEYGVSEASLLPGGEELVATGGHVDLRLASSVDGIEPETRFVLRQGEYATFLLGWRDELPRIGGGEGLLRDAVRWWRRWSEEISYEGPYLDAVVRSAVVLKLLTYAPTGGIVAAPTASLPEVVGGRANWDYRFTWLRDASLMLYALLATGMRHEGDPYFDWLCARAGSGQLSDENPVRIMYDVDGRFEHEDERELAELEGYLGSRPVRVGNGASRQLQLDVYGELLECLSTASLWGREDKLELWDDYRPLADWLCEHWQLPDAGIWEVRGEDRHYVYSKVLAWVGVDRAVRVATANRLPGDVARWAATAEAIRASVLEHGWSARTGAFKQSYDDERLDAANLAVPLVGFLPAEDPRVRSNLERTIAELSEDGLVRRFLPEPDEVLYGEGSFTLCSFWLVNALLADGRTEEAVERFEALLERATPLGLFAEQIDPATGLHLGNHPQGFAHAALLSAAVNLARAAGIGEAPESHRAPEGTAHLVAAG